MDIDSFAPRLSFFWAIGMNHFMEIAKMRAARMLWAKIVKQFNPKKPEIVGIAYTLANIRLVVDRTGSVQQRGSYRYRSYGSCSGSHSVRSTPTLWTKLSLCRQTSLLVLLVTLRSIFRKKTSICKQIDPWAGSYYVEALTNDLAQKAWDRIQEVEKLGGMAAAIETGCA